MPNVAKSDQFNLVQDLIRRQDEALDQLNELNKRVESAIEEVNSFRSVEFATTDLDEVNDGQPNEVLDMPVRQDSKVAKAA